MINVQMDDETSLNQSIIALLSHSDSAEQMDSGDSDNKSKLDILQDYLVKGDREGCCQFAMENDLWSHAFIISHGTHTDLFQRVARGFIDKQLSSPSEEVVPDIPKNRKMLRMLYAMFSGNESDAVSELVRTSDDDHSSSSIIKDWKEALALILANSTTNSQAVISSLGDALYQQGLVYAPSICYILSPQVSLKPRLESGHAPFSLLSVHGTGIPSDTDVFYLAELYEMSLISKGKQDEAVDVQDYKLVHAWWLSDLGYTDEAQDYCEAISKVIGSSDTPETKLESIKQIGEQDLLGLAASNSLYSLLTKDTFNTLIHSIQGKMTAKTDNTTHTAEDTSQDMYQPMNGYNYGYQYGQIEHTESGPHQEVTPSKHQTQPSTFPMHKGIQSPFQSNNMAPDSMKPIQSPFGTQPAYGQVPSYAENNSPSWWNSGNKTNDSPAHDSTSYEPYESTNSYEPATSYQPDVYAPPNTSLTNEPNDEDDILGLGNSSRNKKGPETSDDTKKEVEEDKEDPKQDKKETGGGWGIFSLFSRKEKETKEDEKKPYSICPHSQ
ncbi:Sec23-binding domain of Sec16-domain-containing protein [Pilobolus umbonatus]|nr:Sec23-binding domain of Sec16-domain-containing protein [Pilobolus umbonatus]